MDSCAAPSGLDSRAVTPTRAIIFGERSAARIYPQSRSHDGRHHGIDRRANFSQTLAGGVDEIQLRFGTGAECPMISR